MGIQVRRLRGPVSELPRSRRKIIPPKTDWEFIGYDPDLGAPDGHCDYCRTEIRHVFVIQHEKWATLEVGETLLRQSNHYKLCHHPHEREAATSRSPEAICFALEGRTDGAYVQHDSIRVRIISVGNAFKLRMNEQVGKKIF